MVQQLLLGGALQPEGGPALPAAAPFQQQPGEGQQVLPALAQGRHPQLQGTQPSRQLRRQGALGIDAAHPGDLLSRRAVHGTGQGPRGLRREEVQSAQVEAAAPQEAQQLRLGPLRSQGRGGQAPVGRLGVTQDVETARAALPARPALAPKQQRQLGSGRLGQGRVQSLHGGAVGHPELGRVRRRSPNQDMEPIQQRQEHVQIEGLGQEVVGAQPHGLHDVPGLAEGRHQHHPETGLQPARTTDELEPAHARQAQVRDQHLERPGLKLPQRLLGVGHRLHGPDRPFQRLRQQAAETVLVLDQQQVHGIKLSAIGYRLSALSYRSNTERPRVSWAIMVFSGRFQNAPSTPPSPSWLIADS